MGYCRMKNEIITIIDKRETVFKSIIKDIFMFGTLTFYYWLNYKCLGNSWGLQFILLFCFFMSIFKYGCKRVNQFKTKKEAIEYIDKILN